MNDEDIRKITDAVSNAIDDKTSSFYVEREKHWKHHDFLDKLIDFFDTAQKYTWRTLFILFIFGVLAIIVLGFWFSLWVKLPGLFGGKM